MSRICWASGLEDRPFAEDQMSKALHGKPVILRLDHEPKVADVVISPAAQPRLLRRS
jgi:hypothetical protein